MKKIVLGYWDCMQCSNTHIPGNLDTCPCCGKRVDKDTRYINNGEREYVEETPTNKVSRRPKWVCNYCEQLNPDETNVCVSCGAIRDSSNLDYFQNKAKQKTKVSNNEVTNSVPKNTEERTNNSWNNISSSKFNLTSILMAISGVAIAALVIFLIAFAIMPKEVELKVNSFSWERNISVEKYKPVQESDWNLPTDANLIRTSLEVYSYNRVLDHYETKTRQVAKERIIGYKEVEVGKKDLGNGYFEIETRNEPVYETYYEDEKYQEPVYRNEPIYRTKYYYEIYRWLFERNVKTSANDREPYWGELNLLDDEREGNKTQTYNIIGTDKKGKERTFCVDYECWKSLEKGATYKFEVDILNNATLKD